MNVAEVIDTFALVLQPTACFIIIFYYFTKVFLFTTKRYNNNCHYTKTIKVNFLHARGIQSRFILSPFRVKNEITVFQNIESLCSFFVIHIFE